MLHTDVTHDELNLGVPKFFLEEEFDPDFFDEYFSSEVTDDTIF